jgi:Xaa-Pro dipeptidase
MSIVQQTPLATGSSPQLHLTGPLDRRGDVDAKQTLVANLLKEVACDGLLVLEPDNFSWLTSGGAARGVLDPAAMPALYFTPDARWALCANVDSQRLFDEELDGLGFQLKEWPWHWGRQQLLADLIQGRTVACDVPFAACKLVTEILQKRRCILTDYDKACYRALGLILSHALEAAGRTLTQGETEREVAGQLAHRLLHRGTYPLMIMVAADGRSRTYRQGSFTATPIRNYCVLVAAARKYGLCAMASRAVSFGQAEAEFRKEHDAACRVSATYIAGSWPDSMPRQILNMGRRVYQASDFEHEWRTAPQGHITGRACVERAITPDTEELLQNGSAITWNVTVGAASSCDTFFVTEEGPIAITAVENWPLKRIRIQGADFVRPDILIR